MEDKTIKAFCERLQSISRKDQARVHGLCRPVFLYDFALCVGLEELKQTIRFINENSYRLVSVTQCEDTYTVFFRRPVYE